MDADLQDPPEAILELAAKWQEGYDVYASLLVTIVFLSGVQLMVMGMIGQYVARVYDEARARPLYLVSEARGFDGWADSPVAGPMADGFQQPML